MKITKDIYLMVTMLEHRDEPYVYISDYNMPNNSGSVELARIEVEFDMPSRELITKAMVGGLEGRIEEMRATSEAAINEVKGQIQSLLALEHHDV